MKVLLLLLLPTVVADPAVAELQPVDDESADFVVETEPLEPVSEVEMDEALVKGMIPSGPRLRSYGGRIELEAAMVADGVSAAESDLVFAETASGELATTRRGALRRGRTSVTGWVGLSDGETRLARRQSADDQAVCASREGSTGPEHELDLRLTRPPPAGEAIPQATWEARPSFVMGEDGEGVTGVYTSLQPGDQITVVQITGGPRFVEEVSLQRTGRNLRWRRDHNGESVCYEDFSAE